MITLFANMKPFNDEHIKRIQLNAIKSWHAIFQSYCKIVLFDCDLFIQKTIIDAIPRRFNAPTIFFEKGDYTKDGAPKFDHMLLQIFKKFSNKYYIFSNGDIILLPNVVQCILDIKSKKDNFMLGISPYNVDFDYDLDVTGDWVDIFKNPDPGSNRYPCGIDTFIFTESAIPNYIPPIAAGRVFIDNWLLFQGLKNTGVLIDATFGVTAIHQNHNYHYIGGKKNYFSNPDAIRNRAIVNNEQRIPGYPTGDSFRLNHANYVYKNRTLEEKTK